MKKITVSIGYYDFTFEDMKLAEAFADTAEKTREKDCSVRLEVSYKEDDENEV